MRYVLFVCNHNAGRSQMAQAFFERLAPDDFRAESAGAEPAQAVWPEVVEAMREVGIDLTAEPKKLTTEMQLHADWAVTMGCGDACPFVPTVVEDWDLPDPAGRPIEDVREIRDEIERRVEELITDRAEQIRADRTAHESRLARCCHRSHVISRAGAPTRRSASARMRFSPASTMPACARTWSRSLFAGPANACSGTTATRSPVDERTSAAPPSARRVPRIGLPRRARDRLGDRRADPVTRPTSDCSCSRTRRPPRQDCSRSSSCSGRSPAGTSTPSSRWRTRAFGGISWRDAGSYAPAQVAGCIAGAVIANLMFELAGVSISTHHRLRPRTAARRSSQPPG